MRGAGNEKNSRSSFGADLVDQRLSEQGEAAADG